MNRSGYIKRQLLAEVFQLLYKDRLCEDVDRIPIKLFPRDKASLRCCIYKDRAMVRQRILAILGFSHSQDDEILPLSTFAARALERSETARESLTLMPELCSGCDGGQYRVTDLCRRCVARSCSNACPKDAIHFNGERGLIDQDKCIGCGKCADACAYRAINYHPVPCEERCPVDAIGRDEEGMRYLDQDKCISCGRCVTGCPFGAPLDISHGVDVINGIRKGRKVVALLAPAVMSQFPGDPARLRGALLQTGFAAVYDVGQGAAITTEKEAKEGLEIKARGEGPLFSSCCPAWVLAAEKHAPQLMSRISEVPSPMAITAEHIRKIEPESMTVFIGPCFAKKEEARRLDSVDALLSFEELGALLMARDIQLEDCPAVGFTPLPGWNDALPLQWSFARAGGLGENLKAEITADVNIHGVAGLDKKQLKRLTMADRFFKGIDFVEVMACSEGCVGGPGCLLPPAKGEKQMEEQLKNFVTK